MPFHRCAAAGSGVRCAGLDWWCLWSCHIPVISRQIGHTLLRCAAAAGACCVPWSRLVGGKLVIFSSGAIGPSSWMAGGYDYLTSAAQLTTTCNNAVISTL